MGYFNLLRIVVSRGYINQRKQFMSCKIYKLYPGKIWSFWYILYEMGIYYKHCWTWKL